MQWTPAGTTGTRTLDPSLLRTITSSLLLATALLVPTTRAQARQAPNYAGRPSTAPASLAATDADAATPADADAPVGAEAPVATQPQRRPGPVRPPTSPLARWLDIGGGTAQVRYRGVQTAADRWSTSSMQWTVAGNATVRLDREARYTVGLNMLAGASFNQSWNMAGPGIGDFKRDLPLRQLFVQAAPGGGVAMQVGGFAPIRGQNTEITTLDNDGYLVGERLTLKRRDLLFFDEVSVTNAYLGDLKTPSIFRRADRWNDRNYRQVLLGRRLGSAVNVSGDYAFQAGTHVMRQGVSVKLPAGLGVDSVRVEQYERIEPEAAYGMAMSVEKALSDGSKLGAGLASVDRAFGTLNGERYSVGNRVFFSGSHPLRGPLGLSWFYTYEIDAPAASTNVHRVDFHLAWNFASHLKALTR